MFVVFIVGEKFVFDEILLSLLGLVSEKQCKYNYNLLYACRIQPNHIASGCVCGAAPRGRSMVAKRT